MWPFHSLEKRNRKGGGGGGEQEWRGEGGVGGWRPLEDDREKRKITEGEGQREGRVLEQQAC